MSSTSTTPEHSSERLTAPMSSGAGVVRATVRRVLPNEMFQVETEDGDMLQVHASGKLRNAFVRLLPGDAVRVDRSPFDATKGRLVMPRREAASASAARTQHSVGDRPADKDPQE